MEDHVARTLEDWVWRQFPAQETVNREELLKRARGSDLPREAYDLLTQLPEVEQSKEELVNEIERMTTVHFLGGSAGGTNAGSSGEMRPGAYGAEPDERYGGDQGGGYQP